MKTTLGLLSLTVVALTSAYAATPNGPVQPEHFTKKELKSLAANAKTPEDHRKLAVYYEQQVEREMAEAQRAEQDLMAEQANSANRNPKQSYGRVNYFQYQLERHRNAAEKAQALVAVHREMAGMAPIAVASVAQSKASAETCCVGSCCARNGSC